MREAGMDAHIDAVGNVVGVYRSDAPNAKTLMTGSHYDTVRNGGKYDGRLGILLPIAVVRHLHQRGEKLPFHFEIVGFAEEEGVRFKSTFLGSTAVTGRFDLSLLDQTDADGVSMRDALLAAGHDVTRILPLPAIRPTCWALWKSTSNKARCCWNATWRWAWSPPSPAARAIWSTSRPGQPRRHHADEHAQGRCRCGGGNRAAGRAALRSESLVGTVGQLQVPGGSVNVIPGAASCRSISAPPMMRCAWPP
jgi:N-carbamoyl-L-amino-acid hydrolase